jgi:hypothetical protein
MSFPVRRIAAITAILLQVPAGALSILGRRWYGGLTWGIGR